MGVPDRLAAKLAQQYAEYIDLIKESSANVFADITKLDKFHQMLEKAISNDRFNEAMGEIKICTDALFPENTQAAQEMIGHLRNLSYRTRHLDKIMPQAQAIMDLFELLKTGGHPTENQKISLENYGILHDLACLYPTLVAFKNKGLLPETSQFKTLYEFSKLAKDMIGYLDEAFNSRFRFPTGSVVFNDIDKTSKVKGYINSFFDRIVDSGIKLFFTKYGHVSKGISLKENKISHINPTYTEESFSMRDFLYSEVYQINLEALIDEPTQALLQEHLGDEWLSELSDLYAAIERDLHDNAFNKHQFITHTADMQLASKYLGGFLKGGHRNLLVKHHDNKDIHDRVYGRGHWQNVQKAPKPVLCSKFIGMTIIAAIQELNDQLKEVLMENGVENIPDCLIRSPLSEKEKLSLLMPERLLKALLESGAVKKVQDPSIVTRAIKQEELKEKLTTLKGSTNVAKKDDESGPDSNDLPDLNR